jgi:hypothetical protein
MSLMSRLLLMFLNYLTYLHFLNFRLMPMFLMSHSYRLNP